MKFHLAFQYKKEQIDSFSICPNIDSCLEHLKQHEHLHLVVGGSRQHISNSHSYTATQIFCFDRSESIAGYQPVLVMRKDFPLKNRINQIIGNAFESVLFVKWNRENQRKKQRINPFEPKYALTLVQFAVFLVFIFCIGCILSILSFILEIITQRKMRMMNYHRIWIYFERFLDGKRHYFINLPEQLRRQGDEESDGALNTK